MVASTLQRAASALGAALTGAAEPDVIIDIAPWKLSLVVVLLIVPLAVSVYTRLGLHGALVLAAARCVLQVRPPPPLRERCSTAAAPVSCAAEVTTAW